MPTLLPETTVTATVWTVSATPGGAYPADAARVNTMIDEANKILRQVAMKVTWDGTLSTTNRADWYDLVMTNRSDITGTPAEQLFDCARMTGGVELYFVNTIAFLGDAALGVNTEVGTALSAGADGRTLAHELLHQCGLKDIYNDSGTASVSGPVTAERMDGDDWGGGYYPQGLQQATLNEGRLLMYGVSLPGSLAADIPYGSVYGYGYVSDGSSELELKLVPVGRVNMGTRQPAHR